jgi:hypothetical protein
LSALSSWREAGGQLCGLERLTRRHQRIDLSIQLWEAPILRSDLRADPRFEDESVLTLLKAANPHPLSTNAFQAILERIAV